MSSFRSSRNCSASTSHLPATSEAHEVAWVVLRLQRLEPSQIITEDPIEGRVEHRVVAVEWCAGDVLTLVHSDLCQVRRTLARSVVHRVVSGLCTVRVVDVEREEALSARGWVCGGRLGAVREEGGEEGLDVVADERAGDPGEARAPELSCG